MNLINDKSCAWLNDLPKRENIKSIYFQSCLEIHIWPILIIMSFKFFFCDRSEQYPTNNDN